MNARTAKIAAGWGLSVAIVALTVVMVISLYDAVLRHI